MNAKTRDNLRTLAAGKFVEMNIVEKRKQIREDEENE